MKHGETPFEVASPMKILCIALAKSRSARGAAHQPVLIGSCLTISHTCLP